MSGEEEEFNFSRNRREDVESLPLGPEGLVGSFFHVLENNEIIWQGIVVGEPQPGWYLCELIDCVPGAKVMQRVFPIASFFDEGWEWRFYDDINVMQSAYVQWTIHRDKERQE